jgi:hypothetical protein
MPVKNGNYAIVLGREVLFVTSTTDEYAGVGGASERATVEVKAISAWVMSNKEKPCHTAFA